MSVTGSEQGRPAGAVRVAALDALQPGTMTEVEVNGVSVCLARTTDGAVYAFRNNCSHRDFPLHLGTLEDHQLECAWHGARFDVDTGRALRLPAIKPIRTYPVIVEDGDVLVRVE
jgi:3-phenylpropionate/trans-cinnamate dioxygenase ferredoxin subunit